MTAQAYDAPALDDLLWVADEVWHALLGEEEGLDRLDHPRDMSGGPVETVWSAGVSISGTWQGNVTVELGTTAAVALTARMLALGPGEAVADADLADAIGELVNMIGGNVKSLMPGPSMLSLPMVAAGRAAHSSDSVEALRFDAAWRGEPIRFSVHVPRS